MPMLSKKGWLLWLPAVLLFGSCAKELSCENCSDIATTANKPPVANAGPDQTITLPASKANLNGSGSSDPDNNITNYEWTKISGPSTITVANANSIQTIVSQLVAGTYAFELTVTDSYGLFSKDTSTIVVNNATEVNGNWKRLQVLPEHDFFFGSNHINFLIGIEDKVYAVSKNGSFWFYKPDTNEWLEQGHLPVFMASSNFSVVFSINNIGYFIGNGTCRQYNAANGQWITRNNAPVGANHVDYSVPLVVGNKAYLVGSTNNLVTMYDPSTDTYTPKNKLPDVDAWTGFVINGEGYCIQKEGRCWKYDASTDSWLQKASLPPSIYNMSGFSLNGYGYIIGDLNRTAYNQNARMKMWRYDPSLDQWKQIDVDYPGAAAYEVRTVSLNGIVYAGLGYNSGDMEAIDFWSFK